jgi:predicted nucleic acid-binding protein
MSIALLDVNVLVAPFDPAHANHEDAHRWFGRNRKHGWATCPITINGCIRVLSNPAYPTVEATPAEVTARLRSLCSSIDHHFWPDFGISDRRISVPAIGHRRTPEDHGCVSARSGHAESRPARHLRPLHPDQGGPRRRSPESGYDWQRLTRRSMRSCVSAGLRNRRGSGNAVRVQMQCIRLT